MPESKECNRCGEVKPVEEFHRHKEMRDGRMNRCRACRRPQHQPSADEIAEAERLERAEMSNRARATRRRHRAKTRTREKERHPEKYKAHRAVENAVREGRIVKPERCERCKKTLPKRLIQGHHADYSKPLEVAWLCAPCHRDEHKSARRETTQ